jgi:hypothetical protein
MPACHSGGVGSIAGHSTWDLQGTGFFRRELERCSFSVIQPLLCAHSLLLLLGQECEGGEVETKQHCSGYQ